MSSRVCMYAMPMLVVSAAHAQPAMPRITVNTTPPGARVYVDGKDKGLACQSGPSCKPRMAKGTHRLLLELTAKADRRDDQRHRPAGADVCASAGTGPAGDQEPRDEPLSPRR